ncbi:unnamed protein product [Coffea canephora]|uniref:FBD domain-containing protein n=1 Tax=Coffea canephora TaxID=49390 RepID=A0A068VC37_COFCA|nr:unnamed protein product [Coffea canephora]
MLVEVSLSGWFRNSIRNVLSGISCCLAKLEFLSLYASKLAISESQEEGILDYLPQPTNLKQFVLVACASKDDSLIGFTSFIRASPNLEKFVLKVGYYFRNIYTKFWCCPDSSYSSCLSFVHLLYAMPLSIISHASNFLYFLKSKKALSFLLQHLRVVESLGYYVGIKSEVELINYFLENAIALENIIVDPREELTYRSRPCMKRIKKEKVARSFAKEQLEAKKPFTY